MSAVKPRTALDAFDGITRGQAAPMWVAEGIRRAWGLPDDTEVTLIVLSENATFLVDSGASRLVVRLARPGYATSRAHLRSELLWVEALRGDGVLRTPAPIRGDDGELLQIIHDVGAGEWPAVAFEYVEGTVLEDESDAVVAARMAEIGAATARMHQHSRVWAPPARFSRFAWEVTDMVGASSRWGDWRGAALSEPERALLERAEARARAEFAAAGIDRSPSNYGLIHADLRPSNVMIPRDAASIVVIDFDDCGYGYHLYDFAAALTFYEHRPDAATMAERWISGYSEVVPLGAAQRRAMASLSMLRRLAMLGWATTHREEALPPHLWAENLPGTVEVARRYLSNPGWMLGD